MDQLAAGINAFAQAHPFYFAAATGIGGFFAKAFIFTKENARKLVRAWFNYQRRALKKAGRSDAEIKAIMEDEADFIMSAATEAKAEADGEGAQPAATP